MMANPSAIDWTQAERAYAEAMRAEIVWAPLHFDGWGHYEQARPAMPGEAIEVIGRWPEHGYTLQYRPLLAELTEAWLTPVDQFPEVTVLGRLHENVLPELRSLADQGLVGHLSEVAARLAKTDRTVATEPLVRTGSTIPEHSEVPVHYVPSEGRWLKGGRLIHEDHPSAAYAVAGHWGIRPGPPVGLTPTGLLVFQPAGMKDLRITVEHPVNQPVSVRLTKARVGLFRYNGLGGWEQTSTIRRPDELQLIAQSQEPVRPLSVASLGSRGHQG